MAATTIGALSYQIIADTTKFSQGMQLTRNEITAAKKAMHDSKSDADKYGLALDRLGDLLTKGAIDGKTYTDQLNKVNAEFRELTGETAKAEAQARQFDRMIERGKQLFDSTRTAADRYNEELREMSMLLRRGVIDQEIFNRAKAQSQGRFNQAFIGGQSVQSTPGPGMGAGMLAGAGRMGMGVAGGLGIAIGASAITSEVSQLVRHTFSLSANMEQAEVSFATMLRSASAAKEVLADLQRFSADTPFEFPDVTDAATKLVSFRIEQEKLMPTLKALGDLSAGLRIPLGELADIYGRQKAQGRLFAQDLNQFTGRGVPLIQELSKQFGVAESEVRKLVEQGKVGFENLEEALISLTSEGGQFHDLMKAQSKTMSGLATTLKDEVNLALTEIGTTIAKDLQFRDMLDDMVEIAKVFRSDVLPVFKFGLGEVGAHIKFVQGGFVELLRRWGQLTGNQALLDEIEFSKLVDQGKLPTPGEAGPTHDPLAQDFAAELVRLERRRDALGKSKLEVELMELAQTKYTDAQRESLAAVFREIEAKQKLLDMEDERKKVAQDAAREQEQAARKLGKFMEDLVLDAVKKAKDEAQELQDIAGRITDKVNPGVKLGQELFGVQRALDAGLIGNEEAKLFSDDLMKEFGGRFKQQAPSRTAGAALEKNSAEAFSAIMKAADRGKKDELPKIAQEHLRVAQQTLEQLRQGAAPIEVKVIE